MLSRLYRIAYSVGENNNEIDEFNVKLSIRLVKMDTPGFSLFQGAESININNDQPRIEEEDAIRDRLRRNEEVCQSFSKKSINFIISLKF